MASSGHEYVGGGGVASSGMIMWGLASSGMTMWRVASSSNVEMSMQGCRHLILSMWGGGWGDWSLLLLW